jgi:signal transduction histidine kinase/CheY-like chemotaxis protein
MKSMKVRDIKIGTQITIGLSIILVFILALGAVSFSQTARLSDYMVSLYEHPLTVRRAIGELKADVLAIHRDLKDIMLAGNEQEIEKAIQSINTCEADAFKQFDILHERYLGPKSDIDSADGDFVSWQATYNETIRLLRSGQTAEAINRTKSSGTDGAHVEKLLGDIEKFSDFSKGKGDQFYSDFLKQKSDMLLQLGIILGAVFLLSLLILYFLISGIREPLKILTGSAKKFSLGNYDARSSYSSANEFGVLSDTFNNLAGNIQSEINGRDNAAKINDAMLKELEPKPFCRELLKAMIQHTDSQVGAMFILNDEKKEFMLMESIGLGAGSRKSFSAALKEGEFGMALATHQIQRIIDIPKDTVLSFTAAAADFIPREIVTMPVISGREVIAVISLASLKSYPDSSVKLINDNWSAINSRVSNMIASWKVAELAQKLELQNRELEQQSGELSEQKDELTEQNVELEFQKNQLDEASKLKSVFLSNMSHELRTPLNSVIALSGVLSRRLKTTIPKEEYGYIDVIERNGKHLLELINDILDLSRIEAGKEEISLSRFSIAELVAVVISTVRPQVKEKNIELSNLIGNDVPGIISDFSKCRHILQNIIANAVKFTERGVVEVSAVMVLDMVHIIVKDTGIGIAKDNIPYIFDEFRQADGSTSRKYEGTGLGLSIAKKYAEMLHGLIEAESAPGKGSTFTIKLPLNIEIKPNGAQLKSVEEYDCYDKYIDTATDTDYVNDFTGKTLLIVEDSEPAIIQLEDIFKDKGFNILVSRNGEEALEEIKKRLPDAIILDLMMPKIDGFEVLKKVRSTEESAHIPVIILTAKHISKEELSFLKYNKIFQLIQKGNISRQSLLAAVSNALSVNSENNTLPTGRHLPVKKINTFSRPGKATILVVEDNPDNIKAVKALLQESYFIIEASDGKLGVEMAKQHVPDLVLMDISLPVLDGFQAFAAIRKEKSLEHTPVIALTASAMKGTREEILSYGFDGYLSKPVDVELLKKTVKEAIYGI